MLSLLPNAGTTHPRYPRVDVPVEIHSTESNAENDWHYLENRCPETDNNSAVRNEQDAPYLIGRNLRSQNCSRNCLRVTGLVWVGRVKTRAYHTHPKGVDGCARPEWSRIGKASLGVSDVSFGDTCVSGSGRARHSRLSVTCRDVATNFARRSWLYDHLDAAILLVAEVLVGQGSLGEGNLMSNDKRGIDLT